VHAVGEINEDWIRIPREQGGGLRAALWVGQPAVVEVDVLRPDVERLVLGAHPEQLVSEKDPEASGRSDEAEDDRARTVVLRS